MQMVLDIVKSYTAPPHVLMQDDQRPTIKVHSLKCLFHGTNNRLIKPIMKFNDQVVVH